LQKVSCAATLTERWQQILLEELEAVPRKVNWHTTAEGVVCRHRICRRPKLRDHLLWCNDVIEVCGAQRIDIGINVIRVSSPAATFQAP
jgi:hypothetical protein